MHRCFVRCVGAFAVLLLTVAGLVTVARVAAAATPSLTVTPRTGLVDHDVVQVSGSSFVPNRSVTVQQCAPTEGRCRLNLISSTARVDGAGSFSRDLRVRRLISQPDGPAIDCVIVVCRVVVTEPGADILLSRILTFDPGAPFDPAPTLVATPSTGLPAAADITLRAARFTRNTQVAVSECVISTPADRCVGLSLEMTDANGALDVPARVTRLPAGMAYDCAQVTVHCVVQVVDGSRGDVAGAPIAFDGTTQLPTVAIDPTGPLPYRGYVTLTMQHLTPGIAYTASECYGRDVCGPEVTGTADAAGDLQLRVLVRRIGVDVDEDGAHPLDCAVTAVCRIEVEPRNGDVTQHVSLFLTFDPTAPVPPAPTVSGAPASNLPFRTVVHVTGAGFLAGSPVVVSECPEVPFARACRGTVTVTADAAGRIDTRVAVQRVLSSVLSTVDCAERVGRCILFAEPSGSVDPAEQATADLGFDPTTTPPASPPVHVTPSRALADGQIVQVDGSGFTPRAGLGIMMCSATATFTLRDCDLSNPTLPSADAAGALSQTYAVRAHLSTGNGAVDCTRAPGVCAIAVVNIDDFSQFTLVSVSFGPATDPTPVVSVVSRSITEPTGSPHSTKVDIVLSEPTEHIVRVDWGTRSGTAVSGGDFDPANGTATFLPGETRVTVRVSVIGDRLDEPDEWFTVGLSAPVGATLGSDGRVTIRDDDPRPALRVGSTTVRETDGPQFARVPVTLNAPSGQPVSVHFVTHHLTARAGSDYLRTKGTLVIPAGETRASIVVVVLGDTIHERSEQLVVELDDPGHATIADASSFLTIHDDD